jgi:DNA-directed RNA polymerase delta subunit
MAMADKPRQRKLTDWAYSILSRRGAMQYTDIANVIKAEGYRPRHKQKKSGTQLRDSLWTLLVRDPRFVKVGRGTFDIADRSAKRKR